MGLSTFETWYAVFDADTQRVGLAESINSQLTPAQSAEFNNKRIHKLSLTELFDYHGEKHGLERFNGSTVIISICAAISIILTILIVHFCMKKRESKKTNQEEAREYLTL